jgi:hypothetical protein
MRQGAAAAHPECVLMEFLRDALGLQCIFAMKQRLKHLQPCFHQSSIGKDAAVPDNSGIGVNRDERMD